MRDILDEIEHRRGEIPPTREVRTLYIGGGTPSVLGADCLKRIVDAIGEGPYEEFTVEANPEDIVTKGPLYIEALKEMGVNRVSMGVQSFDDGILRRMGRRHDAQRARKAFKMLREGGIGNISIDLIFGLSDLDDEKWESTIREALNLRPDHISAYQLSIEEGSALEEMVAAGKYTEASDEHCRRQYDKLCANLREAGYHHYEISNFAIKGKEAVHNSAYWRRAPYVGFGPGAHSLGYSSPEVEVPDLRSWNTQEPCGWKRGCEKLSAEEIREERIMLGLRTENGYEGKVIPESEWFVSDEIIRDTL